MSTRVDYFLSRPDRVAALRAECESWRGTPFRKRSAVKGAGGGVDCVGYISTSLFNIGAIAQTIAVPPYEINHAEHSDESLLRAYFERPDVRERVRRVDEDEPHVDGDFVFPIVGRTEHHLGFRVGVDVYHIARPSGFCSMTVSMLKLARSRYRLMEPLA